HKDLSRPGLTGSKREHEHRICKEECDSGNNRDKSFGGSRWTWVLQVLQVLQAQILRNLLVLKHV
ncbi:hypothetical protein Tco_0354520, partial [Tanacetum coccineum]